VILDSVSGKIQRSKISKDVIFLLIPGILRRGETFSYLAKRMVFKGLKTAILDFLEPEKNEINTTTFVFDRVENLFSELETAINFLLKQFPKRKIILLGHSFGAVIAARLV